jgi:hypothetical protein
MNVTADAEFSIRPDVKTTWTSSPFGGAAGFNYTL